ATACAMCQAPSTVMTLPPRSTRSAGCARDGETSAVNRSVRSGRMKLSECEASLAPRYPLVPAKAGTQGCKLERSVTRPLESRLSGEGAGKKRSVGGSLLHKGLPGDPLQVLVITLLAVGLAPVHLVDQPDRLPDVHRPLLGIERAVRGEHDLLERIEQLARD